MHDLAPAGGDTSEEEAAGSEVPTGAALSVDEALLRALVLEEEGKHLEAAELISAAMVAAKRTLDARIRRGSLLLSQYG